MGDEVEVHEFENGDALLLESTTSYAGWDGRLVYSIFYAYLDEGEVGVDDEGEPVEGSKVFQVCNTENYARFEDAKAAFEQRKNSDDPFQAVGLDTCVQRPEEWDEIMASCV